MKESIGADIESICRKCGDVWHVVVSMKDDTIAKVECKQCGGVHRLKRPEGKSVTKTASKKKTTKKKVTRKKAPPEPEVVANPDKAPRAYHPKEVFEPGDTVDHSTFGQGVVQLVRGTKMTVYFSDGERLLVQGRP